MMSGNYYRTGQLARLCGLTERTIRYYDELGLLKTKKKTRGGQRIYTDSDLVYIKRIIELKSLSFSLEEIKRIINLAGEDETGEKRRAVLLENYKSKLSEAEKKKRAAEEEIAQLDWHIRQLEKAGGSFKDCPGSLCSSCSFKENCSFKQS